MTILENDASSVARLLLGWTLLYESPAGRVSGKIVETEAYHQDDPASHTFRGQTKRNRPMFGPAGTIYIYFTYGMHYCLNVVCGPAGRGEGVLLRALEPLEGLDIMRSNRSKKGKIPADLQLTSGPAKLVEALGIPPRLSGTRYNDGPLQLLPGAPLPPEQIVTGTRIGITQAVDELARFYIRDNPFVSRP